MVLSHPSSSIEIWLILDSVSMRNVGMRVTPSMMVGDPWIFLSSVARYLEADGWVTDDWVTDDDMCVTDW